MSKKIGFTCGAFDLLHAGHVIMLEECASQCDELVVGLQVNPQVDRKYKNIPIQALETVDEVVTYETEEDLLEILTSIPIDYRFIGSDWKGKEFTGKNLSGKKYTIIYNTRDHCFSSSNLRKKINESASA